jgi:nitric oxide reductase large subunit
MRTNTYNATTGVITISQNRALAIAETQRDYIDLYTSNKQEYQQLREDKASRCSQSALQSGAK